jgi:hypothetical protein
MRELEGRQNCFVLYGAGRRRFALLTDAMSAFLGEP